MPIIDYQYECPGCGDKGETSQCLKFAEVSDNIPVRCNKCGLKQPGKRVWDSAPAVHYKGTGFFVNDYPKDKK